MKKLILSISAFALIASYSAQITYTDITPDGVVNATYLGETYSNKIERLGRAITPSVYKEVINTLWSNYDS